jgi:hypothetical protein
MLGFLIGLLVGSILGVIFMALMIAGAQGDTQCPAPDERTITVMDSTYYKCKDNPLPPCKSYCCHECMGKSECDWACEGDPVKCGISVIDGRVQNHERISECNPGR